MRKSWKKGIALAVACALVACNSTVTGSVANAATKYVSLNKTSLKLAVKKTAKLQVKKKSGVKVKSTTFKSSNAKVASVTKKGVVTGKSEGTAKITVKVKFKKGKKSGSSTLIAKVTVGNAQVSATPKTSTAPSQGMSNTTNNKTNTAATPTTTTGASATATAKVTATATPVVKATQTPGAEDPKGTEKPEKTTKPTKAPEASEDPEGTEKPEKTTKPTKAPQGTEDPEATEAPEKTPKPTKTPVATEDPEETDGPAATPKPTDSSEISKDEGHYDADNLCWTAAGVYSAEDEEYASDTDYGLVQSWSELTNSKIITVSGNKITKVAVDKIKGSFLVIPEEIKEIGDGAFSGCTKLKHIEGQTFDVELEKIGDKAFSNCTNIETIFLYSNEIGNEAFLGCSSLYSYVPLRQNDVIGKKAFSGCSSLGSVGEIHLTASKVGAGAFDTENLGIVLGYDEIPEGYEAGWYVEGKNIKVYNASKEQINQ